MAKHRLKWAFGLMILALPFFAWTEEQLSGFCFPVSTDLATVQRALDPILLPKDKLDLRSSVNCIELKLSKARMGLFENFLGRQFTLTRTYRENDESMPKSQLKDGQCRVEIIQEGSVQADSTQIQAGTAKTDRGVKTQNSDMVRVRKSMLVLGDGLPGNLEVNGLNVDLVCFLRPNNKVEMIVQLQGKDGRLSTRLNINKGEKVNLGEVVENLAGKHHTASSSSGIQWQKSSTIKKDSYFMFVL